MTFDDILAQVVDLLQRQGRVSYRALKRRFDLDEDYIEDLKAELIKAQRLAVDEDGEMLVWTGDQRTAPPPNPELPLSDPQRPRPEDQPTQTVSPPAEPRTPEAERRQLTVMFCDLVGSTALAVLAHYALGGASFYLGALPAARQHLEAGLALYTPDQRRALVFHIGQDLGVSCGAFAAWALWVLGYPDQALTRLHETLALAHALSHPLSLAFARCWAALVYQWRRAVSAVREQAEAAVVLATAQGFPQWAPLGTIGRGWALAMQGRGEEGIAQIHQGIAAFRATGAAVSFPTLCTVLADVAAYLGHLEVGLRALTEAHTLMEQQEERVWEAEIARLRGVLLLRQTGTPQEEAETWVQRALEVARRQEAKSLELRAAMSLARLWQQQGKRAAARELLAPVYDWFTEGFDTADLQEAQVLLEALR